MLWKRGKLSDHNGCSCQGFSAAHFQPIVNLLVVAHRRFVFVHFNMCISKGSTNCCRLRHTDSSFLGSFLVAHEIVGSRPCAVFLFNFPAAGGRAHRFRNSRVFKAWFCMYKVRIVIDESLRLSWVPLRLVRKINVRTRAKINQNTLVTYNFLLPLIFISFLFSFLYECGPGFLRSEVSIS